MEWHSIDDIALAAETFLQEHVGRSDQRIAPKAGHLSAKIRLPMCDQELEPFLRPGTKMAPRVIVGIRCNGTQPWKLYVPVRLAVTEDVLVARRALPRGHLLAEDDVSIEPRDISGLVGGYVSNPAEMYGRSLKHPIMSGAIITPTMLKAEVLIKRGQTVTLLVRSDSLNIRISGIALMDGVENQRIRIENAMSHRVVEGVVRSREFVEVLVY